MTTQDPTDLTQWMGRTERVDDPLAVTQAQAVAAMLDLDPAPFADGGALPPLWQWFYFLPRAPQQRLATDGHPERGGFLPPVPLPRRMFAGSRMRFLHPLTLGAPATRHGTIADVALKHGKSGALAFVTVRYRFEQRGVTCIEEEQDIVYRDAGAPVPPRVRGALPALPEGAWERTVVPDPRLLFRFSALTFNAHRIHYDRPYAVQEEGYPGLVVHGPLTAVLLADLVRRHTDRPLAAFSFKGLAPLFDGEAVRLEAMPGGDTVALRATAVDGTRAMAAEAVLGASHKAGEAAVRR